MQYIKKKVRDYTNLQIRSIISTETDYLFISEPEAFFLIQFFGLFSYYYVVFLFLFSATSTSYVQVHILSLFFFNAHASSYSESVQSLEITA